MKVSFSPVTLGKSGVSISSLTGRPQAHLTQTVTSSYATQRSSSSTSDNLFSDDELGTETKDFDSIRTFFMKVSDKITADMVNAKLAANPNAKIVRTLASEPILNDEQTAAIAAGLTTLEKIAASQLVKYGENHAQAGQPVLYQGAKQFRRFDFKLEGGEDVDLRVGSSELVSA